MSSKHITPPNSPPDLYATYHSGTKKPLNNGQDREQTILALVKALHNGTREERLDALNLLDSMYRQYKNTRCLQGMKVALQDKSAFVRKRCAETLGRIGKNAAAATINLTYSLKDTCPSVRAQAARALGELGTPSAYVTEELCDALNDSDVRVRYQAAIALGKLRITGIRIVLALENALSDHNRLVQRAARESLNKLHIQKSATQYDHT